ncbi:MAG: DUF2079 domain-containing protein [Deltaproteobacteria bacterium]|nr:DUF2079 domain-containing protein [Deltaproteobacteria bacterium]
MRREALWWLLPAAVAALWGSALAYDMVARVRALACVENYSMAVYQQLIASAAFDGRYFQTIHTGYADSWMWSGHRSLWMLLVPHLYRFWPSAEMMVSLQAAILALGCFPAFGLGWRSVGGPIGGAVGLAIYALFPAAYAVGRADYQELSFGIPFFLVATQQARRNSVVGFVLSAFLLCSVREEWVLSVPLVGLAVPGGVASRLRWAGLGAAVSLAYGLAVAYAGRDFEGYDNQSVGQFAGMLELGVKFNREWADARRFYLGFFVPVQWLALLAPVTLLPALGTIFLHLAAPAQGGVDVVWSGHIHHMAPVVAAVVAASIDGAGVVSRLVARLPRHVNLARGVALVAFGLAIALLGPLWMKATRVDPQLGRWPTASRPPAHAAWALAEQVPPGATVATDRQGSLLVAGRAGSFTYDESLADKLRGRSISALDYVLVPTWDLGTLRQATDLGGAELSRAGGYALVKLP